MDFTIRRPPVIEEFTVSDSPVNGWAGGEIYLSMMAASPDVTVDLYVAETGQAVITDGWITSIAAQDSMDWVQHYDYDLGGFTWSALGMELYRANTSNPDLLPYKAWTQMGWYGEVQGVPLTPRAEPYTLVARVTDPSGKTAEATYPFSFIADDLPPTIHWESWAPADSGIQTSGDVIGDNTPGTAPWLNLGYSTTAPVRFRFDDTDSGVAGVDVYAPNALTGPPVFSAAVYNGQEMLLSDFTLQDDAPGYLMSVKDAAGNTSRMYFNIDRRSPEIHISDLILHQASSLYSVDLKGTVSDATAGIDGSPVIVSISMPATVPLAAMEKPSETWPPGLNSKDFSFAGLQLTPTFGPEGQPTGNAYDSELISVRDRSGLMGRSLVNLSSIHVTDTFSAIPPLLIGSIPPIRLDNVTYDVSEPAAPSDCAWVEKPSGMKIGVRIEPRDPSPSEIIERNNSLGALAGVNIDHSEIPSVQLPYSLPEFTTAGNFTVSPGIYIATPFINFTPYPTPNTNTPSYTCDGGETIQYLSPGSKNLGLQGRADFNVFLAYLQELQPYVDWVPPGNNVKVVSKDLELSFMDVSAGGKVQITENRQYPEIPDYHVAGKHSWEIQVDAAYSSMQLKVCLSTANFSGQQTAEADLYHYNTTSGIWEKITTGRQDNCVVAVSQSASPFAVMVPVDDDVAPRTTGTLNPAGKEAGDKTLYVSTRTYVNYYASDYSIKGDISGVATMYSLIDAEPTEACRDTPYDPAAAPGTCGNPVYKGPFTLGEGVHALYYLSVDKAGNYEEPNNVTLLVDGTPPAAEAFAAGAPVPDDGTAELPETGSVTLAAADPVTSGVASGLAALKYYLDVEPALCGGVAAEPSAPAGTCENPAYAGPFTLAPGTHTVYYTAVDNVGNMAPIRSVSISVNAEAVERASIAPSSGPIGLPFVITGEGFGAYSAGTTVVLIGGATAPLTLWSTDTIRGTVPGGLAAGEYPVAVLRGSEPLAETSSFTVVVPALAGIAPSSGPIGQPFTLTGSGFGNYVAGFTRVLLGGATMPLTLWTDTKIQGAIPGTLPTGDYELLVERALNGGVVRTSTTTFSLRDMEAYWLAPSTGPIGMPFTITGVGFGNYSSVYTHVLIGDTTAPLSLWTDSKIQGTVPGSLVSGQYPVLVERRTADGGLMRTSPMTFEVVNVSVASMTPVAGPIGLPFAIYGTGFGNFSAGYTKVLIGGTTCPLTLWTDIKIQGTIPGSLAAGEHPVVVERTLNGGQVQSLPVAFSVTTPEAYSLSPSSGPIGLPFTITGASFGNYVANYTKVLVGGVAAPVTLWTDTQIKGSIPGSLAAGDHEVVVERALNGGVARTSTFTFTAGTPYLDTISPSTAAVVAPFTITGYNFGNYVANYTKVLINGATTALSLWTDTKIQGKLPFLLAGTYPVQVQRYLNGGLSESATAYINVEEPVISSMTPTSGAVWAVFNLYGAGFGPYDATITKVFVGGVQCALSLWTDTRITGTVPSALSYGTHTVVAMRGQALSNGLEFYLAGGYSPSMMRPGTGPSALEFKLGEVYVYPDPAKGGKVPTFHIEVGTADSVKLKVFTVAGQLAHEATMTGSPQAVGPVYAYEYAWTGHIASGVYYYTVEAERAGKKLKARGRFSVVR
ncbi:MAG: IPT/TIG domain-containing protein [Elusimicrobiales bacterium]